MWIIFKKSLLRQVRNLFQSEFFKQCDVVLHALTIITSFASCLKAPSSSSRHSYHYQIRFFINSLKKPF